MTAKDWQQLAFNLLLGPPIAYLVALLAVVLFLPAVSSGPDGGASLIPFLLIVAIPGLPISYLFSILPALINTLVTSLLARFLPRKGWLLLAAIPAGAFSTWLGAGWVLGAEGQFDSDYLKLLLSATVPIGGAVASLACTALVERLGKPKAHVVETV